LQVGDLVCSKVSHIDTFLVTIISVFEIQRKSLLDRSESIVSFLFLGKWLDSMIVIVIFRGSRTLSVGGFHIRREKEKKK
jgi:hypothetical protein